MQLEVIACHSRIKTDTSWPIALIFNAVINQLILKYGEDNVKLTENNTLGQMAIRNTQTNKHIVISYLDCPDIPHPHDFLFDSNLVRFYGCANVLTVRKHTSAPITGVSYWINNYIWHERDVDEVKSMKIERTENQMLFTGSLYLFREYLSQQQSDKFLVKPYVDSNFKDYLIRTAKHKVALNLDGAAEINTRDIEYLGIGVPMLRPRIVNCVFHNPLLPWVHYIPFERHSDFKLMMGNMIETYDMIINRNDLLQTIANNGYEWYKKNGTVLKNIGILLSVLDLDELR